MHVQSGKHTVAFARADVFASGQALARLDRALHMDRLPGANAPARLDVGGAFDHAAHVDALPGAYTVCALQVPANTQALVALQMGAHDQVLADHGGTMDLDGLLGHQIPGGAQVATADQRLRHVHAPIGAQVAPHLQVPAADHAAASADVLARRDRAAAADTAAALDASARVDDAAHVDARTRVDGARKHDGVGIQMIHFQHFIGRPEGVEQPARIIHAPGVHQGVERLLVAHAVFDIADKPAKAHGARALGAQELLGELHRVVHATPLFPLERARA
ncbi:hypothetical protein SDC9_150138 [bioreactor metagenome]|uniref:Uncharacterized protein n=1 Tax=bioreactor metagenome TaxID=1076179 RepID=A0A645EM88_9ZZZZ